MSMPSQDPGNVYQSPNAAPEKKGKGCVFWGCLITAIVALLIVGLIVAGGAGAYFWAKGQVEAYTEDEPMELPVVEATEEEIAEIESRIEQMQAAVDEGDAPAGDEAVNELVLTADDLNKLIAGNETFKGRIYVRIEDGQIGGDVSISTADIPGINTLVGDDRYFNASADFEVSMEGGVLIVTLADATVKGEALPAEFIQGLQEENLAKEIYDDPEVAEKLRRFESIEVREDKLILRLKKSEEAAAAPNIEVPAGVEEAGAE